jgi:hypothetical protein
VHKFAHLKRPVLQIVASSIVGTALLGLIAIIQYHYGKAIDAAAESQEQLFTLNREVTRVNREIRDMHWGLSLPGQSGFRENTPKIRDHLPDEISALALRFARKGFLNVAVSVGVYALRVETYFRSVESYRTGYQRLGGTTTGGIFGEMSEFAERI